jgi:hypothetical protein
MASGLIQGDQYIKSNEQANTDAKVNPSGIGQNGYTGSSSTPMDRPVKSGFLPDPKSPINTQLRQVDASPIAPAHGMRDRLKTDKYPQITTRNARPVKKSI